MGPLVLVVDDNEDVRQVTGACLRLAGYEVAAARDGAEALKAMRSERPAVVVLDLMMPGTTGYKVRHEMQADPELREVPVVIVTAMGDVHDLPGCTVLRKPIEPDRLLRAVSHCLRH
jgi:adenylate cyclase